MKTPFPNECIDVIFKNYKRFCSINIKNIKKSNGNKKEYKKVKTKIERRKEWFKGYAEERKKKNWYDPVDPLNI